MQVGNKHKRVLTQATFLRALGRSRSPKAGRGVLSTVDGIPFFLQAEVLKPFIDDDLTMSTAPVFYKEQSGKRAVGYDAELLPMVADVYLKFRDACAAENKPVPKQYQHIVTACDIIVRGLARVGIIALVDEATGFERIKERDELAKILEAFVAKEIQKWIRTFDLEFYELICELRGLPLEKAKKRPKYFGLITNNLVYSRLAPGVLAELKKMSPVDEKGHRKTKLFQGLTPDIGHPKLKEHLAGVTSVMRVAKVQGLEWTQFLKLMDGTHPPYKPMPLFDNLDE